ncbi:hypothetical protein AJ78_07211 [Emergomyces pasteurianus Ep9510]|uniref:Reverse transcriptase Ty1/copia-type domain-containing protein n=1 Tax=Emergomyces pasteurianus Ep9510 TaxID=1447872 RepID=A0A1J9Q875_9EURO|nr:hypothetical protein AJ78_07211 [Emergomyces pasteurianus Ep9510]
MVYQFGIDNCAPVSTLIETSPLPDNSPGYNCPPDRRIEYQRIIGSLMYIMLGTRGDIAYAVSMRSRYLFFSQRQITCEMRSVMSGDLRSWDDLCEEKERMER